MFGSHRVTVKCHCGYSVTGHRDDVKDLLVRHHVMDCPNVLQPMQPANPALAPDDRIRDGVVLDLRDNGYMGKDPDSA